MAARKSRAASATPWWTRRNAKRLRLRWSGAQAASLFRQHPVSERSRTAAAGLAPELAYVVFGYADGGYTGPRLANASPIRIEGVRKADNQVGFAVIARRWVVERFFA